MKAAREVIANFLYEDHIEYDENDALKFADSLIGDLRDAGFVLVPIEPSEKMIEAAAKAYALWDRDSNWRDVHGDIYTAMLQASLKEEG